MNHLIIAAMWIVTIAGMYCFMYVLGNISFYLFAKAFGMYDSYMQDRYWRKRGFLRTMSQDGEDWYIRWDE